jgi:hypothetical protein
MERPPLIRDELENWHRLSRGHRFDFFATSEEIQAWLLSALPKAFEPYMLVTSDTTREGRAWVHLPVECALDEFLSCLNVSPARSFNFHIWSKALTPELSFPHGPWVDWVCATNGLLLVQHGRLHDGRQDASAIGVVSRVRNVVTGEVREYDGYVAIYKMLKRVIRKALVYETIIRWPNGTEEEDRWRRMTAGATQQHQAGHPFVNRPGRRLAERT